ncbi:hypothetical protein QJS10_CPB11g01959 [Acorus calamus]|uniref:Uncharacterized protein n=1 Tax=Acorus calamus TaxID=4465 RepID=A0AAV9DTC5_ACOCL|nr:hypothetical protein QJS10_CPB11g01959 [Acorus calamus]
MLAFPNNTAPPRLSLSTTPESRRTTDPTSASYPAVVFIRSPVPMLSFSSTGTREGAFVEGRVDLVDGELLDLESSIAV